ncbi:redox-sensing transcriptional repressor Rex [bacterium]|nr:MAG: redox-sensing transcriptional repressor Rex [bacterium]
MHFDTRKRLGLNQRRNVVLIGVGTLGKPLLCYRNFSEHAYEFAAAFDSDASKIGEKPPGGIIVRDIKDLPAVAKEFSVDIAIITTSAQGAQEAATAAAAAGVRGILNFAPVHLSVPKEMKVKKVDLTTEFDNLAYHLQPG